MLPQLFILGFLHILQPGHGQVLLFSSFTLQNLSFPQLVRLSLIFGFLHSIFLFSLVYFTKNYLQKYHQIYHDFEILFALLIIVIGLYWIYQFFFPPKPICHHEYSTNKFLIYPILLASVIPCPSNMTFLLTHFLNHDSIPFIIGLLSYMLGITISLFFISTLMFIYGKKIIHKWMLKNSKIVFLIAGITILVVGILFLLEVFHPIH